MFTTLKAMSVKNSKLVRGGGGGGNKEMENGKGPIFDLTTAF